MMTYKLLNTPDVVLRNGRDSVPFADGNTDYEAYKLWLSEGNTPEPYTPTPAELNAPILAQLEAIDKKSIRPAREGDAARLAALEVQALALRAQLV